MQGSAPLAGTGRTLLCMQVRTQEIATEFGVARVEIDAAPAAELLLVLTHGAGGGVASRDLLAARKAGLDSSAAVARVMQPYRVAGARAPGSALRQDAAWLEIIATLRQAHGGLPLVQGGRSNGARVACRTAQEAGAIAVIAMAFPLHPPGKGGIPEMSRAGELRGAGVPVLVVNGDRDPFGIPDQADTDRLVVLPGETHSLSRQPDVIAAEVSSWLRDVMKRAGQRY
jgi:predicted alpha/beta-hydrolase family hydrolase